MKPRMLALVSLAGAFAVAAPAVGADGSAPARVSYAEPEVMLQRASESAAEEAGINVPFLPGDRVWTDDQGRAEFEFDYGSVVRLDNRSKLDYTGDDRGASLMLWAGGLYLHVRRGSSFVVETPGGSVEADEPGVYRIDVAAGEARLTVYEGEAVLDSGRGSVRVDAGERSYSRRGERPEPPGRFDRDDDDFARWDRDRESRTAWAGGSRYLPEELAPYDADLESHGSWYYETEVGYVWRPYVPVGWLPYSYGHWVWTIYGWTWIPDEPWGWAPFHYGRWGYSPAIGWYWIPGPVWGPAWVSWATGGDYVGWCPLGRHDRPVSYRRDRGDRGHAVPRSSVGTTAEPDPAASGAWILVRRDDLTVRDVARRRLDRTPADVPEVRVLDAVQLRPGRDLRPIDVRTLPRATPAVRVKPTIGDFVPELRSDPATTIPAPVPRSRPRGDESVPRERDDRALRPGDASPRAPSAVRVPERTAPERSAPATPERRHPTDVRSPEQPDRAPQARPRGDQGDRGLGRDTGRERAPSDDRGREVLRRFFQPVTEPSRGSADDGARARPERGAPRSEPRAGPPPRREEPRTPPPASERAVKRPEEKKKP